MEGNYQSSNKQLREDSFSFEEHTFGSSTSWPARSYACSFCKREFRSAQALGGHMNVHRRDRARMRSGLPYWVSAEYPKLNPNPNPNPSFLISSSSSAASSNLSDDYLPQHAAHHSPLYSPSLTLSSSPSSASTSTEDKRLSIITSSQILPQSGERKMDKSKRSGLGFEESKGFGDQDQHKGFKNNENIISLELGVGLLKHPNEKLDLELRL
ncbi:hypothetical protein L6164_034447 [Bauhinia variegata]|uniref:Uncharacterized protein n=1 Tax=Bauhinia variegata TaxID=167791 RepID=A0ACB9KUR5_BAUVA|nr:hypothetical protein L6164_034447 [Bauhinia variegata]